jgi:type IV pilus assembly protein PilB
MFVPNRELGDFLLDARLLSRGELEHLLARLDDDETLYSYLRKNSAVPDDDLTRAAAHVLGLPFSPIPHERIEQEALLLIPEPAARTHSLAAFAREGGRVSVMLLDLDDLAHAQFLEHEHHLRLVPHLTDRASLKRALLIHQKLLKEKYAARFKNPDPEIVLDALLSHALLSRASEIHLEQGETPGHAALQVRYRAGGTLHSAMALTSSVESLKSKLKELANLSFTLAIPQEGKFKAVLQSGEGVRVRAHVLPAHRGEKITLHLTRLHSEKNVPAGKQGFTLDSLGTHGETLDELHRTLASRSGLILVSAPEGQGKTTAIYTMLDYLSSPQVSIISVEEKIEAPLSHLTQALVRRDLGQTYASTVRASLAHHPDILAIAEIKDEDTAALALSAASRGILVIAGITEADASAGMQKMLEHGVDESLLSRVVRASMGLRVVRKVCPDCKEEYHLARAEAAPLEAIADFGKVLAALKAEGVVGESVQWKELLFARGVGCSRCEEGYKGCIGLQEILPGGSAQPPLNIVEDGLFKAAQGLTSIEEIQGLLE